MRAVTLIVNPAAGRAEQLTRVLPQIKALLKDEDYVARVVHLTAEPHSARDLATAERDADLVLACGGDGTVHGVLQGLAGTDTVLGVLPLGTANALARNLGLALDPVAALRQLLRGEARRVPLGLLTTATESRYFAVMAGCGPDGELVRSLPARAKARLGRTAYYAHAAKLFMSRRWPAFQVAYRPVGSDVWQVARATALMAARVPDLGGLFSGLTSRARLGHPHLQVQLMSGPAHVSLAAWFTLGRLPALRNPWVRQLEVEELRCEPLAAREIHAQADAEPLGPLPVAMKIVPDALRLLMRG